jgi:hypothetical protein
MDASFNTSIKRGRAVYSNILTKQLMINNGVYTTAAKPTVGGAGSNEIVLNQVTGAVNVTPAEFNILSGFTFQPPPAVNLGGSLYFPLSPNPYGYLTIPNSPDFSFGTGNFTVEWFQYLTEPNSFPRVFSMGSYEDAITMAVSIEGDSFYLWINQVPLFDTSVSVNDRWVHFAVVRLSGSISVYLNGIPIASPIANTANMIDSIHNLTIGNESIPTEDASFSGYISNFRMVKGVAVYTSNFTPPTGPLTAIPNTVLLINSQLPSTAFIDNSGTGKVITSVNTTWEINSPFN